MQILFSKTGIPYIEVDSDTRMSFSRITATTKGYKYLVVCAARTTTLNLSGAKAKRKKTIEINEDSNFTVRLSDFKRSDISSFPKGIVSPISLKVIKEVIMENLDSDGYLHYDKIPIVNDCLIKSYNDDTEFIDDDPTAIESFDSVKTVKPRKTKKVKEIKPVKITAKIKMPTIQA